MIANIYSEMETVVHAHMPDCAYWFTRDMNLVREHVMFPPWKKLLMFVWHNHLSKHQMVSVSDSVSELLSLTGKATPCNVQWDYPGTHTHTHSHVLGWCCFSQISIFRNAEDVIRNIMMQLWEVWINGFQFSKSYMILGKGV